MATVKGIALETVPMTWGDLWVERAAAANVRNLLAQSLDDDLTRITGDFGRQFRTRPKIVTFASAASFEEGLKTPFRSLAQNAGGALILEQRTIVINWAVLGCERPLTILRHELSHAMVRDVAGHAAELPAWFDEGLATLEQSTTPGSERKVEDDIYVATALVSGGRVRSVSSRRSKTSIVRPPRCRDAPTPSSRSVLSSSASAPDSPDSPRS